MIWRKKIVKQALRQQHEENIKELKELGIHYVTLEEYLNNETYKYAIGIIPTNRPSTLEQLGFSRWRKEK